MSTYPTNGFAADQDWAAAFHAAASLDYSNDQRRYPAHHDDAEHTDYQPLRDPRHPCGNSGCDQLTEALYCCELCREETEGPDHEIDDEDTESSVRSGGAPLPEAPCSVNVRVSIHGYDCQVTLRDHDEATLLHRLETLLRRYPMEAAQAQGSPSTPTCPIHQVPMKEQHGKDGSTWHSHKTANGWCKGKVTGGQRHG